MEEKARVLGLDPSLTKPKRRLNLSALRDYGVALTFGAMVLGLALSSSAFLTFGNLVNILNDNAPLLIIAAAGTMVFIAGGFDISVGAIYALSGVVATSVALNVGSGLGFAAGALSGLAIGVVNGLVVNYGRINSFIATLATAYVIRGIAIVVTRGHTIMVDAPSFSSLGRGEFLGVKLGIWVMVVVVALLSFTLSKTIFGRHVFATGGNAEAARLSGVRVEVVRTLTFVVSGLAAGIGGTIAASRFAAGKADAGMGLEFSVIAAIVIGGTSIMGGEGAVWRSVIGVLFIALIGNGWVLLALDPIYQQILTGMIILSVVAVDAWSRRSS